MNSYSPGRKVLSEYILNLLSKPFTKFILKTNCSANFITFLGGFLALIGIILFPANKLLSTLFIFLYLILDLVDGDIARAKNNFSKLGKWSDSIIDKSVESLLIFTAFIEYKGNYLIEVCLFIIISCVYITQFSMEILGSETRVDRSYLLTEKQQNLNFNKSNSKFNQSRYFPLIRYKHYLIILLDNLSLGHSTLILMFTVGTLLFNAQLIIPIITLQSIYTLIYVLFSHYRICIKS